MCANKLFNKIKNPKLRKLLTDMPLRTRVFFVISILGTLAFALFNGVAGVVYKSLWYGSLAAYYIFLILLKLLLIVFAKRVAMKYSHDPQKLEKEQWRIYLINGALLLVLDLALTAATVQMATTQKPVQTHMIMAIATAAYAFFRIISATVKSIRNRKTSDIMLQVICNISLVAAIVSMLALTSTMISTFGTFESMRTMLACVSVGVSVAIISLSVFMIVKGAFKMKISVNCGE